jgi:hypothetical protein
MSDEAYEVRYCALVDILGFRGFIEQLKLGTLKFTDIRKLLREINSPLPGRDANRVAHSDLRIQSISDAVVISTAANEAGLSQLLYSLEQLYIHFLFSGYFLRGAIVKGKLYHDEFNVFGEALIEAGRLEREIVRYPRIMLIREVAEAAKNQNLSNYVRQADDGPYFLHVLNDLEQRWAEEIERNSPFKMEDSDEMLFFVGVGDALHKRYRESVDNPRHFEKVQWFVRYWNSVVEPKKIEGLGPIRGSGLDQPAGR